MASEDIIVFYTAWNHPEPIIQKISELFDVNVKLAYADEDFAGGNCGFLECDQGQLQYEWSPDYLDKLQNSAIMYGRMISMLTISNLIIIPS